MKDVWKGFALALAFLAYVYGVFLFGQEVKHRAAERDRQSQQSEAK